MFILYCQFSACSLTNAGYFTVYNLDSNTVYNLNSNSDTSEVILCFARVVLKGFVIYGFLRSSTSEKVKCYISPFVF